MSATASDKKREKNKEVRKIIFNFVYILLTIGIIIGFGLLDPNVKDFFTQLGSLNPLWILLAASCMLLSWALESWLLCYVTSFIFKGFNYLKSFKVSMIGVYYSALTPFSSGGQPMQVAHMRHDGVPVGKSTSVFCMKFITFEFVICGFFIISFLTNGTYFFQVHPEVFWFSVFGFCINAFLAGVALFALINKGKMMLIGTKTVQLLARINIIKHPEKSIISLSNTLEDFNTCGTMLRTNFKLLAGSVLLTAAQMFAQFAITYCIYRALGLSSYSLFAVVSMQALLYLTVSFVPLPGASIASEGGFYLFFAMFFPAEMMFLAMLMWRFFTYYANIIFGAMFVVYDTIKSMVQRRRRTVVEKARA